MSLNIDQITQDLMIWMQEFVEKPNPALGNWAPCPYARKARIDDQIRITFSEAADLYQTILDSLPGLDQQEVTVICFDHTQIIAEQLESLVQTWNSELMPQNYVILEDHPNSRETVNGIQMNFGKCGLLVLQKLDKLNQASELLRDKGYYDVWCSAELDQVVTWRYKSDSHNS
jgi:hypothetical protein